MTDSVTIDLRAYEREQDDAERRMRRIRAKVRDLLEDDYDPYDVKNFDKAMRRIDLGDVALALSKCHFSAAGAILDQLVRKYWEDRAWKQAANEIDNDDGT